MSFTSPLGTSNPETVRGFFLKCNHITFVDFDPRNGFSPCYTEIAEDSRCLKTFHIATGAKVVLASVTGKSGEYFSLPNILISFILSTLISTSRKYLSPPVLPSIAHIAAKLRTTLAKRIFPRLEDLKVFGCLVLGLTQKE